MIEKIDQEIKSFLIKIILPALVALSIKIAIQHKQEKVSAFNVVCSFITGIGSAYLFSNVVICNFSDEWTPVIIAMVAISGEKIGYWAIYKLDIEKIMESLLSKIIVKKKK